MDLFTFMENATSTDCDHLPLADRKWEGSKLICTKCGKVIRTLEEQHAVSQLP